jgi:hypothetical protein
VIDLPAGFVCAANPTTMNITQAKVQMIVIRQLRINVPRKIDNIADGQIRVKATFKKEFLAPPLDRQAPSPVK